MASQKDFHVKKIKKQGMQQVGCKVRDSFMDQMGEQVWRHGRNKVMNKVIEQVYDQVCNQVLTQVCDKIWYQSFSGFQWESLRSSLESRK